MMSQPAAAMATAAAAAWQQQQPMAWQPLPARRLTTGAGLVVVVLLVVLMLLLLVVIGYIYIYHTIYIFLQRRRGRLQYGRVGGLVHKHGSNPAAAALRTCASWMLCVYMHRTWALYIVCRVVRTRVGIRNLFPLLLWIGLYRQRLQRVVHLLPFVQPFYLLLEILGWALVHGLGVGTWCLVHSVAGLSVCAGGVMWPVKAVWTDARTPAHAALMCVANGRRKRKTSKQTHTAHTRRCSGAGLRGVVTLFLVIVGQVLGIKPDVLGGISAAATQ